MQVQNSQQPINGIVLAEGTVPTAKPAIPASPIAEDILSPETDPQDDLNLKDFQEAGKAAAWLSIVGAGVGAGLSTMAAVQETGVANVSNPRVLALTTSFTVAAGMSGYVASEFLVNDESADLSAEEALQRTAKKQGIHVVVSSTVGGAISGAAAGWTVKSVATGAALGAATALVARMPEDIGEWWSGEEDKSYHPDFIGP